MTLFKSILSGAMITASFAACQSSQEVQVGSNVIAGEILPVSDSPDGARAPAEQGGAVFLDGKPTGINLRQIRLQNSSIELNGIRIIDRTDLNGKSERIYFHQGQRYKSEIDASGNILLTPMINLSTTSRDRVDVIVHLLGKEVPAQTTGLLCAGSATDECHSLRFDPATSTAQFSREALGAVESVRLKALDAKEVTLRIAGQTLPLAAYHVDLERERLHVGGRVNLTFELPDSAVERLNQVQQRLTQALDSNLNPPTIRTVAISDRTSTKSVRSPSVVGSPIRDSETAAAGVGI